MDSSPFFMFELLLGHLVGDYLLQNDWMALNKKDKWFPAIVHCIIYSLVVNIFMISYFSSIWMFFLSFIVVFLTHIILDKTDLVDKYGKLIGGRTWKKTEEYDNEIYTNFTCLVKVAVDNTFHLLMMWIWFVSI